jgi:hypothetical protein
MPFYLQIQVMPYADLSVNLLWAALAEVELCSMYAATLVSTNGDGQSHEKSKLIHLHLAAKCTVCLKFLVVFPGGWWEGK